MRQLWVLIHRWFGLLTAAFLFIAGLTGAIISWDHELDDWLNPHLSSVNSTGVPLSPLEIAKRFEAANPEAQVGYLPLLVEPGESLSLFVTPRVDPRTNQLHELGYNQVFFDPVTGEELGRREWGKVALDREHIVPFLYKLHYSLHIPIVAGNDRWGLWLMGAIALIWTVDCFIGFYLTLPSRKVTRRRTLWRRWAPAWKLRWKAGGHRLNFDAHRASGLWLWPLLFILAVSAVSLNLYDEVAKPLVSSLTEFTPSPFDQREARPYNAPITPAVGFDEIQRLAQEEGARRAWSEPVGAIGYAELHGIYNVKFHFPGDDHGAAGVGPKRLYFDSQDGRLLGDFIPWRGTGGDLFLQVQFPLHSGRIAGIPGRILISLMGVAVAALSVTGVVIWMRKRRSRAFKTSGVLLHAAASSST